MSISAIRSFGQSAQPHFASIISFDVGASKNYEGSLKVRVTKEKGDTFEIKRKDGEGPTLTGRDATEASTVFVQGVNDLALLI